MYYYRFIIKDAIQEQPNRRDAQGKALGMGDRSFPGTPHSQNLNVFTQKLSEPQSLEGFMETYVGMADEIIGHLLLTHSSAPLPSLEVRCGLESFKVLIKMWSFWRPAPILKL